MIITSKLKLFSIQAAALFVCLPELGDSLIITSVLAGDKKFKTISFDHKWLKPLTFEKEMPNTEFRRHRTVRPPKFDIDVNIPIKLPLEDEYPQDEYKKPVESNIFFQTGELHEPNYQKPAHGADQYAAATSSASSVAKQAAPETGGLQLNMKDGLKGLLPALAKSIKIQPQFITESHISNARSDAMMASASMLNRDQQQAPPMFMMNPGMSAGLPDQFANRNYAPASYPQYQQQQQQQQQQQPYQAGGYNQEPEFIPAGFVNLQLSGPTGGPKMTYEDIDKERWAQQLSQTAGAMPYPILNYHQLQNFYGGLGTFTNGLAEHRYVETGLLDKLKSGLNHLTNKFHFG